MTNLPTIAIWGILAVAQTGAPAQQEVRLLPPETLAAILGAVVGGILATLGGLVTQGVLARKDRQRRKKSLIAGLGQEVRSLQVVLQTAWSLVDEAREKVVIGSGFFVPWTSLSPQHFQVFAAAGYDLSLLPPNLMRSVVAFYGSVLALNEFVVAYKERQDDFVPEWARFLAIQAQGRFQSVIDESGHLIQGDRRL